MEKKNRRPDLILAAGITAIGFLILVVVLVSARPGKVVTVSVDGQCVAELKLDKNTEYTIEGYDGGSNLLVIQNGSAWIEEASCPDGLCRKMGKISRSGQSIICLPNRVVVAIENASSAEATEEDGGDVDSVVR